MALLDPMTVLKGVCLASGAAMHVAPLPTMKEIRIARSTLNFHIAPYASTMLNHLVNLWYALIRGDGPLIIHRICGITAQAYYLFTYLTFCPPHKLKDNQKWLYWVGGILCGIFAWLHILLPLASAASAYNNHIAFFGAITGIGLAASPLATVGEVLRKKDASSLPVHLCGMVTLQCFSWMVYGYLRDDLSTFSNNLVGVILGSIQLTLIWMYGSKRSTTSLTSTDNSSSSSLTNTNTGNNGNTNSAAGAVPTGNTLLPSLSPTTILSVTGTNSSTALARRGSNSAILSTVHDDETIVHGIMDEEQSIGNTNNLPYDRRGSGNNNSSNNILNNVGTAVTMDSSHERKVHST